MQPHPRLHQLTVAQRLLLEAVGEQFKSQIGFNIFEHLSPSADPPEPAREPTEGEALNAITTSSKVLHAAEAACDANRKQLHKAMLWAQEIGAKADQGHALVQEATSKQDVAKRTYDILYGPGGAPPDPGATPTPSPHNSPVPDDQVDMSDTCKRDREQDQADASERARLSGLAQGAGGPPPSKRANVPTQPTQLEDDQAAAQVASRALAAAAAAATVSGSA